MLVGWLVGGFVLVIAVLLVLASGRGPARRASRNTARSACMGGEDDPQ